MYTESLLSQRAIQHVENNGPERQLEDSVPELQFRNAMRDGTIWSLRNCRAKQILDLGCGRSGVIPATEIRPVGDQDSYSDAGGVACAAVPL